MNFSDDIISKDSELNPIIYNILNEAYHEFQQMYGDKHSEHIKYLIESITDKVKTASMYYSGPIASAHAEMGVVYTKSDKLSAVLKHEMWHVYNNSASDFEVSLQHIPERYIETLEKSGYLRELYDNTMSEYKEKWKDEPERLEHLLVDYDEWKQNRFDFGDSQIEMWTEWFNSQTHLKDMKDNYQDWQDGFFTKSHSSGSFYDAYINIASMISCIIPKDKLLDMYLQTNDYKTDYSYPEMQDEFDSKYSDALEPEERSKYEFPYMKIIMDIQTIDENARKNPETAQQALQSCMKTCFNAYLIKLNNIKELDVQEAKDIFAEIKYMQENMLWNVDASKMAGLNYIQSLQRVQDKFKKLAGMLDLENPEVRQMLENIDYTAENPFQVIESRKNISKRIGKEQEDKDTVITIGNGKAIVGQGGIKDNLYASLFATMGKEKYNLLFQKGNNVLQEISEQIERATTDQEVALVYSRIYKLYAQKLEECLKTDENIETVFKRCSLEIVELQKNGLLNPDTKEYSPELESIIQIYNERLNEYISQIDAITERDIQSGLQRGLSIEDSKRNAERIPNIVKAKLQDRRNNIANQRQKQVETLISKEQRYPISMGLEDSCIKIAEGQKTRDIINGQNELKDNYNQIENPTQVLDEDKRNIEE